jgi:aspartyl-tRNA(Asn)/glutamyl-tRNA(Gln) amidotransferase subunit A
LGEKWVDGTQMYLGDLYTVPVNIAGLPAMSVPCGFDENGMPIGLQLIADAFCEENIFSFGYALENAYKGR